MQDILSLAAPKADARVAYGPGEFQFADLRVPAGAGPFPVAVVIHGGFWRAAYDLTHLGRLCEALRQAGVATWSPEFRRIGHAGGGWPGTFEDVRAGAAYLAKIAGVRRLDLGRVVAVGHSSGGHLALWLGAEKPLALRGVVALAAVADLRRAWELKLSRGVSGELLGGR
jgi:acetyl esterase/lipase